MSDSGIKSILADLWRDGGGDLAALAFARLTGEEPSLPSSFRMGAIAQASVAAAGLAAAEIHHRRGAARQTVSVDVRHASTDFRSERHCSIDGNPTPDPWDRIAGVYRCGDGHWVRLHANFPHHRDGVLAILNCAHDRDAVARALQDRKAEDFEAEATARGLVVAMLRSFAEWDAHPQAKAIASTPLIAAERLDDAPAIALPPLAARPLVGLRVLDLTRIIAGPVCGRTLAAHGADVMLVTAPHLPAIGALTLDTGRGKLSTQLDLRLESDRAAMRELVRGADVVVHGYRPGGLGDLGFGPEDCCRLKPGLVYVSLSAYGHEGPWAGKRGFDSLVQTATGFNKAEADAAGSTTPKPLPCQALDHGTGYLLAFAAMMALMRRAREGGSWHVRLSLGRTALWLRSLGRLANGFDGPDATTGDIADLLETTPSGFGALTAVRHPAILADTPARWTRPSVPLGTHAPVWTALHESQ